VEAFVWKRDETVPYAVIYQCPYCKDFGERPTNLSDIEKTEYFSGSGLHRARALERVAPLNDPDRHHVEEALEVYLPRAIYALVTIINKLNSIPISNPNQHLIRALLLLAFDRANTLWLYPKERQRPKQLVVPSTFRENNIWSALESAIELWTNSCLSIPLVKWPEAPPPHGGICLYEGRIKELALNLPKIDVNAVLCAFPRPNQAYWTLSALWSGWLWGPEVVEDFKIVLRRRRYDWGWHANAIQSALISLESDLSKETPYFGIISELETGFLSSVLLGIKFSNIHLQNIGLRTQDEQALIFCKHRKDPTTSKPDPENAIEMICSSAREYLQLQRGEPTYYPYLYAAILEALVKNKYKISSKSPNETLSEVHLAIQKSLTYKNGFVRYGGSDKSLEVGLWWLREPEVTIEPLADRVEMAIVNDLIRNPGSSILALDEALCQRFPGLTPPDIELMHVCLESYGYQDLTDAKKWFIKNSDLPEKRRSDIFEMREILVNLGKKLGFITYTDHAKMRVDWTSRTERIKYKFFVSASAVLGKYITSTSNDPQSSIILLPGSRSNLILYKLRCNPYLQRMVDQGWRFLKYRHLRRLFESTTISLENLDEQLSLDPLTYSQPQIRLL
jgi:hypothetical protein